ncbi:MAG TPA: DOPA 4,5-dioxygenase family protein [Burkholderiaceae bacterium]|nr:DOPA 4,5-dioxygenase family protein [Burkholderiaceae bacterium]
MVQPPSDLPVTRIVSFHAHVYYDPAATRVVAERLRERISDLFVVQLGRWHDRPVGPHVQAMYQVAFAPPVFASFVPWLMLNRDGLTVLVHANTLEPYRDHTEHALWLGEKLPIKGEVLDARIEPSQQDPVTPNSRAASQSGTR